MNKHNPGLVYIVTGAAGHLGGAVVKKLNETGKTVYALCLPGEKHMPAGENITVFTGDICDTESLSAIFGSCAGRPAAVIHCAGIVSIASKSDKKVYDVNVGGTKNIISLCEKYNIEKLVYISSVHAIPEVPGGGTVFEGDSFSPDSVIGLYAKTKAEATRCVLDYAGRGRKASIVHPSGIVGPGDFGKGHITQLVIDYCRGRLFFGIDGGYDFVDVRDVAEGILACCEFGVGGRCYILSGRYFKVFEILDMLSEITGKKKIKKMLPMWFLKATAPLSEFYYKILRQPPLFTPYSIYTLRTNANFSSGRAAVELGYAARPMRETLKDTIEWLKENGRI